MNKDEAIRTLKLFNEKAVDLLRSSFTKHLQENGMSVSLSSSEGGPLEIKHKLPSEESIKAFILTVRFFIQDNESTSIRNLSKLYDDENLDISDEGKKDYRWLRDQLNSEFEKKSFLTIDKEAPTYRKIFDTFIYGGFAHANSEKKEIYDYWISNPYIRKFIEMEFMKILSYFLNCVIYLKKLNVETLEEIKK